MNNKIKNAKPPIFRKLDEDFWIAGCLDEDDLERAAASGIATIINILPEDDEKCILSDEHAKKIFEHGSWHGLSPHADLWPSAQ